MSQLHFNVRACVGLCGSRCIQAIILICVAADAANAATFHGLGFITSPIAGTSDSFATAISSDGIAVTGTSSGHVFRWTEATGMQDLGAPANAILTFANDISDGGKVIVGYASTLSKTNPLLSENNSFIWTSSSGIQPLGNPPGYSQGIASGISSDGMVIVGRGENDSPGTSRAYRWTVDEGFTLLGNLDALHTAAMAVSDDGSMIAGGGDSGKAFLWIGDAAPIAIPKPDRNWRDMGATNIAHDGSAVVGLGQDFDTFEPFVFDPTTGQSIGLSLILGEGRACAVSNHAAVVVGSLGEGWPRGAFIWDARNGMRNLQTALVSEFGLGPELAGWKLTHATDISADGATIVGTGIDPQGHQQAWIAHVPEPTGIVHASLGILSFLLLITRFGRRR